MPQKIKRTAILLTLGISLHNFPEGVATYVTASSNLEMGLGIAGGGLTIFLKGWPLPGRFMPPRDQNAPPCSGPEYRAWRKFSGRTGVADTGKPGFTGGDGRHYGRSCGIMVALSVDELMPLAKEIDLTIIRVMGCCAECL